MYLFQYAGLEDVALYLARTQMLVAGDVDAVYALLASLAIAVLVFAVFFHQRGEVLVFTHCIAVHRGIVHNVGVTEPFAQLFIFGFRRRKFIKHNSIVIPLQ